MIAVALIVIEVVTWSRGIPVEEDLHVFERRDRDALAPDLAQTHRVVRVVPHQGRHVEGGGEPGLPVVEEIVESAVRVFGSAESGEHPHGPCLAAVHVAVDPPREGIGSRLLILDSRIAGHVIPRVEEAKGNSREGSGITGRGVPVPAEGRFSRLGVRGGVAAGGCGIGASGLVHSVLLQRGRDRSRPD